MTSLTSMTELCPLLVKMFAEVLSMLLCAVYLKDCPKAEN